MRYSRSSDLQRLPDSLQPVLEMSLLCQLSSVASIQAGGVATAKFFRRSGAFILGDPTLLKTLSMTTALCTVRGRRSFS